ncbi:MAG: hypothetical protein WBD81_23355, partial [Collimonas pratensis]|uniref:hypothetical protein n=1 Tax=Collimonas pratensis TaxID=279113 RepID=UPI003C77B839
MDQDIFFALSNYVVTTRPASMLYPISDAKDADALNAVRQSPSMLAKIVARKNAHSHIRCYAFFSITLAAYV